MQNEPVILELLGHRRLVGNLSEQEVAGSKFLRIDCPTTDGKMVTQYYSPAAVYCITPTTTEMVAKLANGDTPAPVSRFDLLQPDSSNTTTDFEDPEDDDPSDFTS